MELPYIPAKALSALKGIGLSVASGWSLRAQEKRTTLLLIWENDSIEEDNRWPYQRPRYGRGTWRQPPWGRIRQTPPNHQRQKPTISTFTEPRSNITPPTRRTIATSTSDFPFRRDTATSISDFPSSSRTISTSTLDLPSSKRTTTTSTSGLPSPLAEKGNALLKPAAASTPQQGPWLGVEESGRGNANLKEAHPGIVHEATRGKTPTYCETSTSKPAPQTRGKNKEPENHIVETCIPQPPSIQEKQSQKVLRQQQQQQRLQEQQLQKELKRQQQEERIINHELKAARRRCRMKFTSIVVILVLAYSVCLLHGFAVKKSGGLGLVLALAAIAPLLFSFNNDNTDRRVRVNEDNFSNATNDIYQLVDGYSLTVSP